MSVCMHYAECVYDSSLSVLHASMLNFLSAFAHVHYVPVRVVHTCIMYLFAHVHYVPVRHTCLMYLCGTRALCTLHTCIMYLAHVHYVPVRVDLLHEEFLLLIEHQIHLELGFQQHEPFDGCTVNRGRADHLYASSMCDV
jgi:hypothetical protein